MCARRWGKGCVVCVREKGEEGAGVREREGRGVLVCARERRGRGGVGVCAKEEAKFWKMIYENFGYKLFSKILKGVFQSTENVFSLTSILQVNKVPFVSM